MPRPTRHRWWGWKLSAFFTTSILITLWFCRNSLFGEGLFIRKLGGVELSPYGRTPLDLYSYRSAWYGFTQPPDKVRREMKGELLGRGWKLVYEDEEEMYFKEPHNLDDTPWACFIDAKGRTDRYTCLIGLQTESSVIQDLARNMFHPSYWSGMQELPLAEPQYPGSWKATDLGDRVAVDFTWKNLSNENTEFQLEDFYYGGVESIENPPFRTVLKPWTRATLRLTFPARARTQVADHAYKFGTHTVGSRPSVQKGGSALVDPIVSLARDKSNHTLVIRLPRQKLPMDIRNVRVVVNYMVALHKPETFHIKPGETLRIPLSPGSIKRGTYQAISIKGDSRLGENKRWRSFELTPQ